MKIDWKVSRDNKKAILNGGDLEVEIVKIDDISKAKQQKISNKFGGICGFSKVESGNIYECVITSNKLENIFNNINIETASTFIPQLWSKLGDIYIEDKK